MQREIGGYLELERFGGTPYHAAKDGALALNCGRACLEYLIELRQPRLLWLPDWLCSSVYEVCEKCGVKIRKYRVGADMRPVYDFVIGDGEYLYLMDYYGFLTTGDVELATQHARGRLIVDEAQGFFRRPWPGVDTLYTCRKFFGVPDGAYLYVADGLRLARELPRGESHAAMDFVLGRFERPAGEFFEQARANNARFASDPMQLMSALTNNLLRAVDYGEARRRREENYAYLCERLGRLNLLKTPHVDGPFMYPLLLEDASSLRGQLAGRGIFVPTLWPNVVQNEAAGSVARRYSEHLLPLPVDQRYGIEEMERMAKELETLLR